MGKSEWQDFNRHNLDPNSELFATSPRAFDNLQAYVLALLAWPLHTASCCDHTFSHALEPTDRFELSTYRLQGGCATTAPRWLNRPSAVSALFFVLLTDYPGFIVLEVSDTNGFQIRTPNMRFGTARVGIEPTNPGVKVLCLTAWRPGIAAAEFFPPLL